MTEWKQTAGFLVNGVSASVRRMSNRSRVEKRTRVEDHSALLDRYLARLGASSGLPKVLLEIGAGLTTKALATHARRVGAQAHSIDTNAELIAGVDAEVNSDGVVTFHNGTSLEMLPGILREVQKIDFAFLDSAPSAMTTWQEFALIEPFLKSGAIVVVDNACLPGEVATLSPCRKGKIVVPFLLASSWWEVEGHPQSGDSMVVAIRHDDPHYADPDFEGAWNDDWKKRVSDGR